MQRVTMWMTAVLLVVGPPCVWGVEGEAGDESLGLEEVLDVLSRERRDVLKQNRNVSGFSWKERVKLIRLHNEIRRQVGASNMRHITWNTELEKLAKTLLENCSNEATSSPHHRSTATFDYVGENLWEGKDGYSVAAVVNAWVLEKDDYDLENDTCISRSPCYHYTQVVWASTYAIGCVVKYCDPWYRVGCMYGPGGNHTGGVPYVVEKPCTACPKEAQKCDEGLCRPDLTCSHVVCKGKIMPDVCECNTTDPSPRTTETTPGSKLTEADTTLETLGNHSKLAVPILDELSKIVGSAAFLVASPVMTVSLLALTVLAPRQY